MVLQGLGGAEMADFIDFAFVANDLDARAKAGGFDGLSEDSLCELAEQLATPEATAILDDYEARLGVDVSWARARIAALSAQP